MVLIRLRYAALRARSIIWTVGFWDLLLKAAEAFDTIVRFTGSTESIEIAINVKKAFRPVFTHKSSIIVFFVNLHLLSAMFR